jgi:CheY-like chemotaxis protein
LSAYLKTVLVLDDKESIRIAISLVLEDFGYSVRCAEDGHSALRKIHQQSPDILVSDLAMPGMSGFELLINVKRLFPAIKVIAMSGSFSGSEVPHGILADGFYAKGGSVSALLQTLRSLPRMKQRIVETAASLQSPVLLAYEQR